MAEPTPIPMLALEAEHGEYWDELLGAVETVLRHGQFIMGPEVAAFESEVAEHLGARHAIGCNSGTDALVLALRALGIGPGDEVITSSFTFFATAESISAVGAEPVFVDIEPGSMNLDADLVAAAVTARTKALIPVHLFGQPADLQAVGAVASAHGLAVVEDVAQAFGARFGDRNVGTIGSAGTYSFFPSKTLGGIGDGGLVTTDDDDVADQCRMLRTHGSRKRYHNEAIGYNSRLDTIQAAALRVKLRRIDAANAARVLVADRYDAGLKGIEGVTTPVRLDGRTHVFHQYTLRIDGGRRDGVAAALAEQGIASMVYYPIPCHQLPVYAHLGVQLPETERAATEVLSLPISPAMADDAVERVIAAVVEALDG